ncbi:MAG: portal protein [Candidatus Thorarchaeota archaeon]
MAKLDQAQVKSLAQHVISEHAPMMSLYQLLADHFYPERSDFTVTRNVGTELADLLVDSYPILVRRDLGDSLSAMLRDGDWFEMGVNGEPDQLGKMWLQWASKRLKTLFDDRSSNFVRATKEGDHDFITFGSTGISIELNRKADGLLFRCWHLKDLSWWDGVDGQVEGVVRTWKPTYQEVIDYFGIDNVSEKMREAKGKDRFKRGHIKHIVMPSHMYGDEEIMQRHPYVSIYLDIEDDINLEITGINNKMYVIPRFKTIPGSPFAYSPATTIGLPDGRSLQEVQHTLMEAGERYARPPILATQKVIRGDVDLSADGITWVDKEYDERLGASLRTLQQDRGGWPIGRELRENIVETLRSAFYANKLTLPDTNREMTAYEVAERMKQYRRENLPLFEPIEVEYNGQICELAFEIAMTAGLLGSPYDVPESLTDRDVVFKFQSPLSESEEEKKVTQFQQVIGITKQATELDPNAAMNVNMDEALRDAISGSGAPEKWKSDPEAVAQGRQAAAQIQAAQAAADAGVPLTNE